MNPEQAEIVKLIYRLFLEGMTPHTIAIHLTEKGIKTPGGKDKWNATTIRRILTNEKYLFFVYKNTRLIYNLDFF